VFPTDNRIICVVGPTASGKTGLAIALAKALDGEVVSCDSMQLYRGMDVGTAKPTLAEMGGVVHHMLDVCDPAEAFSVGRYVAMADPILQDILARGKTVLVAGGTGLYVDSLMAGRTFAPFPATGRREALEALADRDGIEAVLALLRDVDPDSAARLHPADRKRIIRAMEVYEETGKTITQHNLETQAIPPKYDPVWLGLDFADRAELYRRIDLRVDLMAQQGLEDEVRRLLAAGVSADATAMQAIGYKEVVRALEGQCTMAEALADVQRESRRYAKRQLTWFRRNKAIHWIVQPTDVVAEAMRILEGTP
jgi:tRNA dimethylallyltransferase